MRTVLQATVLALIVFWAHSAASRQGAPVVGEASTNGVTLRVVMESPPRAGQAVDAQVTVENRGGKAVYFRANGDCGDFNMGVYEVDGTLRVAVPRTSFGQSIRGAQELGVVTRNMMEGISVGERYSITLNLARFFDLTRGGQYELRMWQRIDPLSQNSFDLVLPPTLFTVRHSATAGTVSKIAP